LTLGLISRLPAAPAGHHCQPARQARSLQAFSREPPSLVPTQRCCVGPARLGPRNNLAVLSTPKPRTHAAYAARDPLVWDPAAERPAAAEIGGRPHQFEMRPTLSTPGIPQIMPSRRPHMSRSESAERLVLRFIRPLLWFLMTFFVFDAFLRRRAALRAPLLTPLLTIACTLAVGGCQEGTESPYRNAPEWTVDEWEPPDPGAAPAGTPVSRHGHLSVDGLDLV